MRILIDRRPDNEKPYDNRATTPTPPHDQATEPQNPEGPTPEDQDREPSHKYTPNFKDLQAVHAYLRRNEATARMVSQATGIPVGAVFYCTECLRHMSLLWKTCRAYDKHTGYKAWYMTTDPRNAPAPSPTQKPQ